MQRLRVLGAVAFLVSLAVSAERPALDRLDELLSLIRAGDEARMRAFVDTSFADGMKKAGPGDPGIRPFLNELARKHRGFDVLRTITPAPDSVTAVVRSVAQPARVFRLNLKVQPAPPYFVEGLFVLPALEEDLPEDPGRLTPAEAIEAYRKEVDRLAESGELSGVVLLARGNEVVVQRAAGEADRANHVPNTPDTVFGLASMNKMFTAVAIAKLVEQGRLAWSDPVGKHLKGWLPDDLATSITVEQLLTHTSGLGDYLEKIDTDPALRSARSLSAYRALVRASTIAGKPEDGMRYSNTGYVVLGALIEAVSGRDYFDFVRAEIFAPAGMSRTDSWCRDEIVERRAVGYIPPDEAEAMGLGQGWRTNQRFEGVRGTSAGGGMSTAGDLFRFARALVGGKIIKPETLAVLLTPRVTFLPGSHYGYGFVLQDEAGTKAFGHSGGFPGVNGLLRIYGDGAWTLVVLSNVSEGAGDAAVGWGALAKKLGPQPATTR